MRLSCLQYREGRPPVTLRPVWYNDNDPFVAQWLRNLIDGGHIPNGHVDERSIEDIAPGDLAGYRQHHFFAGIGVWAFALGRAGWPADRPIWTGSCPCQPFSVSGRRKGVADKRHLWPAWFRLIEQCRPWTIMGEQVASPDAIPWLDNVFDDLEGENYACGAVDFPACGAGAPNIRQRLLWVGDTPGEGPFPGAYPGIHSREESPGSRDGEFKRPSETNGYWRAADWLWCRDDKHRPAEPATHPLAYGAAARVGRLRAYGNAVNAEVAREVIGAYMNVRGIVPDFGQMAAE